MIRLNCLMLHQLSETLLSKTHDRPSHWPCVPNSIHTHTATHLIHHIRVIVSGVYQLSEGIRDPNLGHGAFKIHRDATLKHSDDSGIQHTSECLISDTAHHLKL
jgi:hypothetical protein